MHAPRPQPHRRARGWPATGRPARSARPRRTAGGRPWVATCSPCWRPSRLLAANAFFVGAEFALISARRDRLEAMADAGGRGRPDRAAGRRRPVPHARRVPAGHHDLLAAAGPARRARGGAPHRGPAGAGRACPTPCCTRSPSRCRWSIVVVAHILLGEMVPKNIAIAGPERTAIWLVPPFLVFTTVMRPLIELFNFMANGVLRLLGVEPRDELETAFTSGELADLIAESGREGLLDDDESRRLSRTLRSVGGDGGRRRRAADELVTLPARPTVEDVAARCRPYRILPVPGARRRRPAHRVPARQGHPRPRRRAQPPPFRPSGSAGCPRCPPRRGSTRRSRCCDARGRTWAGRWTGGETVGPGRDGGPRRALRRRRQRRHARRPLTGRSAPTPSGRCAQE